MEWWYHLIDLLPFSWTHYTFMKNALLGALLVAPVLAVLGTMVVSNRLVFLSDVLGHSALTGIALGMLLGMGDPQPAMVAFAVILAVGVSFFRQRTQAAMDTVLGVFFAFVVALGIMLLSRQGGFVKYTVYLIGDILAVTPAQLGILCGLCVLVWLYWYLAGNALVMDSINPSLARSRGVKIFLVETGFTVLLAVVVTIALRLVGILIINSLLVLPAAASRLVSRTVRSYTFFAVAVSLFSSVCGLIASYYWGTASGATIVLFAAACYAVAGIVGRRQTGR